MGRPRLLRAGLGAARGSVRRRGGAGLAAAGRRRAPRQRPARQRGGPGEAQATGANPTDRGECGSTRQLLTDGQGRPSALVLSGATRTARQQPAALRDATVSAPPAPVEGAAAADGAGPAAAGPHLTPDRGYAGEECRAAAAARGSTVHLPPTRRAACPLPPPGHPDRHPPRRWGVEVAHRWCHRGRRLRLRWEQRPAHSRACVQLAAGLIGYRKLRQARALPA